MNRKRKLGSRKFWALLSGFISSLLNALHFTDNNIVQVTGVITAFGSIVIYILAEASIDKASVQKEDPK